MRPRDIAIVGTLALIALIAIADALRSHQDASGPVSSSVTTGVSTERRDRPDELVPIAADGSLVVASGTNCRIREYRVDTASVLPTPPLVTGCEISGAPTGRFVAHTTARSDPAFGVASLRLVDLGDPQRRQKRLFALDGRVAWSPDGRRAAWCDPFTRNGRDLLLGRPKARTLARCPLAYTQLGEPALAYRRRLVAGGRTLVVASAPIEAASFSSDGSFAILAGRRMERWNDGRLEQARTLPSEIGEEPALFAPDNCAALFELENEVRLVDVGCFNDDRSFPGTQAAWSPDGRWIAAATDDGISFFNVFASAEVAEWPIDAQDIAWR